MFDPNGKDETLAFLNLISACGLIDSNALGPDTNGAPQIAGVTSVDIYGGQSVIQSTDVYVETSRVVMRTEDHPVMNIDVCKAWLTGTSLQSDGISDRYGRVGASQGNEHGGEGLEDPWVLDRAVIDCEEARASAKNAVNEISSNPRWASVTNPSQIWGGAHDVCRMSGADFWARIVHGGLTVVTAFVFAFAMIGLTLGTALAQILLGVMVMFLPLLLLAAAIPMQSTKGLLRRVAKMAVTAMFAHAIFLFVLALMVLMMDILIDVVLASTAPGDVQRTIFLAMMPLIVKWIIGNLSKQINPNLDMSGIKGTMKLTSGLAAGAMGGDMGANRARHYGNRVSRMATHGMVGAASGRGLRLAPAAASAGGAVGAAGAAAGATGAASARAGRGGAAKKAFNSVKSGAPSIRFGDGTLAQPYKPPKSGPAAPPVAAPPVAAPPVAAPPVAAPPVAAPPVAAPPVAAPPTGSSPLIGDSRPDTPIGGLYTPPRRSGYKGDESEMPGWDRKYDPIHGWHHARTETDDSAPVGIPEPEPATADDGTVSETNAAREPAAADTSGSSEAADPLTRGQRAVTAAAKTARFMRRHALASFAVAGALTGVGIPAAALVYVGGKAMKRSVRLPVKAAGALAGKGKQQITDARDRYHRKALEEAEDATSRTSTSGARLTPRAVGPAGQGGPAKQAPPRGQQPRPAQSDQPPNADAYYERNAPPDNE